jgi:hypothetical protein
MQMTLLDVRARGDLEFEDRWILGKLAGTVIGVDKALTFVP